ncbi:MAG TPA: hypothetical protein VFU86_09100 [Terriglobales bacterium]|nr:hypothetical protein [Terriglobales bacterium]
MKKGGQFLDLEGKLSEIEEPARTRWNWAQEKAACAAGHAKLKFAT